MRIKRWANSALLLLVVCCTTTTKSQDLSQNNRSPNVAPFSPNPLDPNYNNNPYGASDRPFTQDGHYDPFGATPDQGWRYDDRNYLDDFDNSIIRESTYFVVASKMVRPGQLYKVFVIILKEKHPITVRASIQRDGVEVVSHYENCKVNIPETLLMKVPYTSAPGEYKLRVEGLYENVLGGAAFINETKLTFSQRSLTILIQLDKPIYKQNEIIRFRTIPINTELKAFSNIIDVYMLDPRGLIVKRWLSRQSNLGTVSLAYPLSDQPVFGEWKIRVVAQRQIEEATFLVEEYYQTRFEVNVTMPAFFFTDDAYIHGTVMANYTSGAPVRGNLTLRAQIRQITPLHQRERPQNERDYRDPYNSYEQYNNYNNIYNYPIKELYFKFDEELPFWFNIPEHFYNPIPSLKFFYGVYHFKYPLEDLRRQVPSLDNTEIVITATIGDRYLDEIIEGHSMARIYNSSIKLSFLGDSPQVFKPGMPHTIYVVASFHDGSPIPVERLLESQMQLHIEMQGRGVNEPPILTGPLRMSESPGIWKYRIDLQDALKRNELLPSSSARTKDIVNSIDRMKIRAVFRDVKGDVIEQNLLLLGHYSPENKHIKVSTSTDEPKVGEYIILHIRSNYFVDKFNYIVISKGNIIITGDHVMEDYVSTMAVTLSAEMAPVSTFVVWHIGRHGDVIADSLTFPVNGISRNKFKVFINNKKARTGHKVEVAIYGEPGAYVGLSGIDKVMYSMQAGNELTYAKVITKMSSFDEQTNGTLRFNWLSHAGNPDELVYFPSSTFGIDANRTFEYSGLVVFSDIPVPYRYTYCNASLGDGECLDGTCYRLEKKCDGYIDCDDGSDEIGYNYAILYGPQLNCDAANRYIFNKKEFVVRTSGNLYMNNTAKEYKYNEYCVDTNYETNSERLFDVIWICENRNAIKLQWILTKIFVIITCICLILTIIIYIWVYKAEKLVEKVIICFCLVDLIFWIMYALRVFQVDLKYCITFGYIYFFINIARLSWLNVLCYEIWRTIGSTRSNVTRTRRSLFKKMWYYFLYGMGLPTLVTGIYIMSHQKLYTLPEKLIPHINPSGCNVDMRGLDENVGHLHLYIPVSILIIINLIFFIITIKHFLQIKSDLNKITKSNTVEHKKMLKANNQKGFIVFKLGLIMGITWLYYLYSYIHSFIGETVLADIGSVLSFANILEGVYFLVIFTIKMRTVKKVGNKLNICTGTDSQISTSSSNKAITESTSAMDMQTISETK